MSDQNQHSHDSIEEILAAYSDQIQTDPNPTAVPQSEDQDLKLLQDAVLFLSQAAPDGPTQEQAQQIKANVRAAWQKQYQPKPSMLEKISQMFARPTKPVYQSATRRRQLFAVRITAAAALVIIAAFIVLPAVGISGGETSGTASGEFGIWALFVGLLLLAGFGLWRWFSSRRK
jgi:hypothetical protein